MNYFSTLMHKNHTKASLNYYRTCHMSHKSTENECNGPQFSQQKVPNLPSTMTIAKVADTFETKMFFSSKKNSQY